MNITIMNKRLLACFLLTVLYCSCTQNEVVTGMGKGKEVSIQELSDIFIKQQENNVENINLVTPTSYIPQIIEAIKIVVPAFVK